MRSVIVNGMRGAAWAAAACVAGVPHLGTPVPLSALPYGDTDPLGITGATADDRSNGLVFNVACSGMFSGYGNVIADHVPAAWRRDRRLGRTRAQ
jgi:hypothetical protein